MKEYLKSIDVKLYPNDLFAPAGVCARISLVRQERLQESHGTMMIKSSVEILVASIGQVMNCNQRLAWF